MGSLAARDLDAILDFTLEARAFEDVDAFRRGVLPGLRRLVACDSVGYNEIDLHRGSAFGVSDPADAMFEGIDELFLAVAHQHPLVARQQAGDLRTYKLSDFLTAREFHRLELCQDFYRRLETEDQIAFGLLPGAVMIAYAINRSRRGFSERDRQVLERLRPHLAEAYVQARERERASAVVAAQQAGLDEGNTAVILLDADGRVVHASGTARELLASYFGREPRDGTLLPPSFADWVASHSPEASPEPLRCVGPRGRLHVRDLNGQVPEPWRGLLLDEQRMRPPDVESLRARGLTRRQAQVLRLLTCGKRTQQIADELFVSPATVSKHLQHIYSRLGVESRAQAIARVLG